jgi:hypothetical protein
MLSYILLKFIIYHFLIQVHMNGRALVDTSVLSSSGIIGILMAPNANVERIDQVSNQYFSTRFYLAKYILGPQNFKIF